MSSPRYAPAREDGTKPYVVTVHDWGRSLERLVYTHKRSEARYAADAASRPGVYMRACRRATPEDVTNLKEYR